MIDIQKALIKSNSLLDNMKLIDGDLLVVDTKFDKNKMSSYDYNESYEGIFLYITGSYPYEEEMDIVDSLYVNIIINRCGEEETVVRYPIDKDVYWKDIKRIVISKLVREINYIKQFEYAIDSHIEYLGNGVVYELEDREKIKNIMRKWRSTHNNISTLDIVGIENIKIEKPSIKLGDVYQYKNNMRFKIDEWCYQEWRRMEEGYKQEGKESKLYRALKNSGFTESQTKELIKKHSDKLEAVKIGYVYIDKDGGSSVMSSIGDAQPILLGLGISSLKALIASARFKTIWTNDLEYEYIQDLKEEQEVMKEMINDREDSNIKKVSVKEGEDPIWDWQ